MGQISGNDPFLSLIAGLDDTTSASSFYSQLCESMCQSVGLERAVLFQYDPDLRRVQPLGAHGLALSVFSEVYVSPDTASFVRDALDRDDVLEVVGPSLLDQTPSAFQGLAVGRRVVCVPMIAAGRWVGLMLADRSDATEPLTDEERGLLRTLGKGVALATMARRATRKDERTRALRQRLDLARDVHDKVVQRLFGVGMALQGDGPLPAEDRARCAVEVQAAMVQLRTVVRGADGTEERIPDTSFEEALNRWAAAHTDLDLTLDQESPDTIPPQLQGLAQAMLSESLRNARKHASPAHIRVRAAREEGTVVVAVENDGVQVHTPPPAGTGMGLRILGIQALNLGGFLEFGARGEGAWQVRLVVPVRGE